MGNEYTEEEREYVDRLEPWVINRLCEILCFTAPEDRRVKLLALLVDVQSETIEQFADE